MMVGVELLRSWGDGGVLQRWSEGGVIIWVKRGVGDEEVRRCVDQVWVIRFIINV